MDKKKISSNLRRFQSIMQKNSFRFRIIVIEEKMEIWVYIAFIYSFILLTVPSANALTWAEFWGPFVEGAQNYSRIRNRTETCYKVVRFEEYVPGNEWSAGFVRHKTEKHSIHCPY